jgi:hypothetical protein
MSETGDNASREYSSEVLFMIKDFRTDLLLYRERAALLIPDRDQRNTFVITNDGESIRYFLKSTSQTGLSYMKAFFSKLYMCNFEKMDPPGFEPLRTVVLKTALRNFRGRQKYSAGFVRTLTGGLSSVRDLMYTVEVIVESSNRLSARRRHYGFSVRITLSGDPVTFDSAISVIRESLREMKEDKGPVLKLTEKKRFRLLRNLLKDPFQLSSVIRIPEDEGLLISGPVAQA